MCQCIIYYFTKIRFLKKEFQIKLSNFNDFLDDGAI